MKRAVLIFYALIFACMMAGCGRTDEVAPSGANSKTSSTGPVANVAVSGHVVNVAQGKDLGQVTNLEMVHPQFGLSPPDVATPVIFGVVENADKGAVSPVVLKKVGGGWKIAELLEAGNQEWVFAGVCGPRKEAWGILDAAGDDRAETLTLMHSADEGASWQFFAAVKKPVKDAEYSAFSMDQVGVGRLTVYLADDTPAITHGYYHFATADGGKTWTGPTFEGDDLNDADSLKDMDTIQEAIKKAETPPAQ